MSIPPVNSSTPSVQSQPVAQAPTPGAVNVDVTEKKLINADPGANIVELIDSKIPPGATVEYCHGSVERTKPDDINAPVKVGTYFNQALKKNCYSMNILLEIKIKSAEGKEEILQIKLERITTLTVPMIKFPNREADRAYQAFALGSEYAKTISAVFDPNHPEYYKMQGENKEHLRKDDSMKIRLRTYDSAKIFHGYCSSYVSWKDSKSLSGKRVKEIERDLSNEVYKIDTVADKIIRAQPDEKIDNKDIFDGVDILKRDQNVTVTSDWFNELKELEQLDQKDIIVRLQEKKIEEKDYIQRLGRRASDVFYNSMSKFGNGKYKTIQFPQLFAQLQELQQKPNKSPEEIQYINDMKIDFDKIDGHIKDMQHFEGQLEELLKKHPDISLFWSLPGGTSEDALIARWPPSTIRKKIEYMTALKDALKNVF